MGNEPPVLDYAPPRVRRSWQWWIIRVAVAVAAIMLLLYCWHWWENYQLQQRRLRAVNSIAQYARKFATDAIEEGRHYTAPKDQVIFEQDAKRARGLMPRNPQGQSVNFRGRKLLDLGHQSVGPNDGLPSPVEYTPAFWRLAMSSMAQDPAHDYGARHAGIAFLHEREAKDGNKQLVRVRLGLLSRTQPVLSPLIVRLEDPTRRQARQRLLGICIGEQDILRVYAGQIDPNDRSHFTIEYELNGNRGTIDGWLDEGEQVRLQPRSGAIDENRTIRLWTPPGSRGTPADLPEGAIWP